MSDLDAFWIHTVTVETKQGSAGTGAVYAPPVAVACFVEDERRLVRDAQAREVISETTIYANPEHAAKFTVGSRVRLPSRTATVITMALRDSGDLDLPDHVEANLT